MFLFVSHIVFAYHISHLSTHPYIRLYMFDSTFLLVFIYTDIAIIIIIIIIIIINFSLLFHSYYSYRLLRLDPHKPRSPQGGHGNFRRPNLYEPLRERRAVGTYELEE